MTRLFFIALITGGIMFLIINAVDEISEEATVYPLGERTRLAYATTKRENPDGFRRVMIYNWLYSMGLISLGFVGLRIQSHYDRLDPMSLDLPYPNDEPNDEQET